MDLSWSAVLTLENADGEGELGNTRRPYHQWLYWRWVQRKMGSKIKSGLLGRSRIPSSIIIMRVSSATSDSSYQAGKKKIPTGGNTIVGGSMGEICFLTRLGGHHVAANLNDSDRRRKR